MVKMLGITGTFQAGKDTVAGIIGWRRYSCSDVIREECRRMGLSIDINQNLVDVGDELRKSSNDAGVLAKKVIGRIFADGTNAAIVVSIRTLAELYALKNTPNADFRLLVLDAPIEKRFERAKNDVRFKTMSFFEFKAQEDRQMHGTESYSMHLSKVFEQADARLWNDFASIEELHTAVMHVLKEWGWGV